MDAAVVRDSQILLERMAETPEAVLEGLDRTELGTLITELRILADRASGVQAEADLLYVADAVYRLVEETPSFAALLLPHDARVTAAQKQRKRRKVTAAYDEAAYRKNRHAQERAAQIRNHVVKARQRLERALQEQRR